MKFTRLLLVLAIFAIALPTQAQSGKKKKKEKTEKSAEPQEKKKLGSKLKAFGNKLKNKVQRGIGSAFTKATSDLAPCAMTVAYKQNMYPEDMIGNVTKMKWEPGASVVFSSFTNREGAGLLKIEGDVKLDGTSIEHAGMGIYGTSVDNTPAQHQIEVTTETGQSAELTIDPVATVDIISINGVPKGQPITINGREDLILELEHGADAIGTNVTVSFVGKIPGTTWLYDIAIVGSNQKVIIPNEAFLNPYAGGFKYLEDNYLVVSRNVEEILNIDNVGAVRTISSAMDWTPVTLITDFEKNFLGQTVETVIGVDAHVESNDIQGRLTKPNAFLGQPLAEGKKLAVASFVIRATKLSQVRSYDYSYKETSFESTPEYNAVVTTTTNVEVEKSSSFPKIEDHEWEKLVAAFYRDFEKELLDKWNISLVPIEQTMQAQNYNGLIPIKDALTNEVMVKGYKGSKLLIPTSFKDFGFRPKVTFPSDLPEVRLMRELGVDGVIGVTIDCEMSFGTGALVPRMAVQITGLPNGPNAGPTVFMNGVFSGKGTAFEDAQASTSTMTELLGEVMQKDDLINAFGQSIYQMKEQEVKKKYNALWDLKELK